MLKYGFGGKLTIPPYYRNQPNKKYLFPQHQ